MTYGSPLSKFASLWPYIVPTNVSDSCFESSVEWINVFDPTDPVSDRTQHFNVIEDGPTTTDQQKLNPHPRLREVPYKADRIHLLSHLDYLKFNPSRENPLVSQVAGWLLTGEPFLIPQGARCEWPESQSMVIRFYTAARFFVWVILILVITVLLAALVPFVMHLIPSLPGLIKPMTNVVDAWIDTMRSLLPLSAYSQAPAKGLLAYVYDLASRSVVYLIAELTIATVIVLLVGSIAWLRARRKGSHV
jgi:hypothetical protein